MRSAHSRFRRGEEKAAKKSKKRSESDDLEKIAMRTTVGRPVERQGASVGAPKGRVPGMDLPSAANLFLSSDLVIPSGIGACGDLLYELREKRLELNRAVAALAEKESALQEHIINSLPKSDATGVRGKVAQVSIISKEVGTARDWNKIFNYVQKKGAWDLLQHRLNDAAVAARWEEGEKIPGVEKFQVNKVSCTKLGGKK